MFHKFLVSDKCLFLFFKEFLEVENRLLEGTKLVFQEETIYLLIDL
jgi:hypothetical protein